MDAWCTRGFFTQISRHTLDYYISFQEHLLQLITIYDWNMAKKEIYYYTKKWGIIRSNATSRLVAMCQIYVSLRDAHASKWISPKLEQERTMALHTRVAALEKTSGTGTSAAGGSALCSRCGMNFHGASGCPFSHLGAKKAKLAAKKAFRNLAKLDGGDEAGDDSS